MKRSVYHLLFLATILLTGIFILTKTCLIKQTRHASDKTCLIYDNSMCQQTFEAVSNTEPNVSDRVEETASVVSNTDVTAHAVATIKVVESPVNMEETAEENCPETVFHGETDDMRVTVSAAEGVFPYGTEMRVEPVDSKVDLQAVNNSGHKASDAMAVDITFWLENEEVQPAGNVSVFLHAKREIAGNMHQAVTIDDNGVAVGHAI